MFNDAQNTLLNPLQAIASALGGSQQQMTPDQQDRATAQNTMMGQLGALLLAGGQRMTPQARAAIIAGAAPVIGGYQRDVLNAAQARLMQSKATQEQEEQQRQAAIKERLQDPAFAQSLGMTPEMAATLGVPGAIDVLKARAARDPMDAAYKAAMIQHLQNGDPLEKEYKQAQIDDLRSGRGRADPYKDTMAREKAQFDARMAQGQQLGLSGEDLQQYASTGKLQTANEKQTQDQANSALFSSRMQQSNKIISDPKIYEYGMGVKGTMNRANDAIPLIGHAFTDPQYQQFDQAQRDFVNAVLRRESGAAISQGEFDNARKQYFPQVGDSPEVLKQKPANRDLAIKGIFEAAAPQYRRTHPLESAAPEAAPAGGSPYPQYPDARQAPDGHWYVQQNGKYHRIDN